MMTTGIAVAFAVSGCQIDAAINTSNNADPVPAYGHNSMSANNSSSPSTDF